jgi:putative ABC transport system permease protein
LNQLHFISGQNLQKDDEIILGKGLADSLDAKIGDTITVLTQTIQGQLNGTDLIVAGIFHMGIKAIDDQYYRLSLSQAQNLLATDRVESFSLETTGIDDWEKVDSQVKSTSSILEAIRFEVLDKVYYQNSIDFLAAQFSFIRFIILFIVALGIFNTIAVGLLERGAEIGALRANGETRLRLFKVLTIESILVGILGGLIGTLIAFFVQLLLSKGILMPPGPGITRQYLIFLEILPSHLIQALLLPIIATAVASFIPTRKLLKKSIPDLLRAT